MWILPYVLGFDQRCSKGPIYLLPHPGHLAVPGDILSYQDWRGAYWHPVWAKQGTLPDILQCPRQAPEWQAMFKTKDILSPSASSAKVEIPWFGPLYYERQNSNSLLSSSPERWEHKFRECRSFAPNPSSLSGRGKTKFRSAWITPGALPLLPGPELLLVFPGLKVTPCVFFCFVCNFQSSTNSYCGKIQKK